MNDMDLTILEWHSSAQFSYECWIRVYGNIGGRIYEVNYIDLQVSKEVLSIQKFSMRELDSELGLLAI